ncbi:MAG TPA: amidohydrolase family protein [Stellaceae bacterium]|jgi:predicted TIM-barrel fold metal-dependent hydrolase|nr:amidohydrolase family protein [Stellaceae bacterium]
MNTIHGNWNDAPDAVTLIDAHHHLWDLRMGQHPWLCGGEEKEFFMGDYAPLKRNYLPEDYRPDAAGHNVLTTVHCEAEWDRADQVGETRWISAIHRENGFPGAIVAHAWFDTDNAEEVIAAQATFPLVRGIRSKPVTAPSPDRIEPGAPGTMQDERWLRGFELLQKYKLSWDLRVPFWHLEEAAAVARAFPNTPIVLNHTGFPWDRSEEGLRAWRRAMEILAREPNVHLKVSEFGLKDRAWEYPSNLRVVLDALAIFGIERAMFASNFPVAGLRIGYGALVAAMSQMLADRSPEERDRFFWKNAMTFYRL